MIRADSEVFRRVRMLVEVLPAVAAEDCFALKGGTAINLFLLDLPRLSVDIDLTYLPVSGYDTARKDIDRALRRIRARLLGGSPPFDVATGGGDATGLIDTLEVSRGDEGIKIEVNPVLRGTLHPARSLAIRPVAEEHFGFARMSVLAHEDLYAGKLVAALDRQHPRDLFDVKLLLGNDGLTDSLFRAFLVYLAGHKGVIARTLDPRRKDISQPYRDQFIGMVAAPVSLEDLVEARERLIHTVHAWLGDREKQFLISLKRMQPDWDLLGVAGADTLPAIRWKLHNLGKMDAARHKAAVDNLERVLEKIQKAEP